MRERTKRTRALLTLQSHLVHAKKCSMRRAVRALAFVTLSLMGTVIACGSPLDAAGTGCSKDEDCAAGLSCLDLASAPGQDCRTLLRVCSKPCKTSADCKAVGASFECIPTCDGNGTCSHTR